jgi:hypothetical protein
MDASPETGRAGWERRAGGDLIEGQFPDVPGAHPPVDKGAPRVHADETVAQDDVQALVAPEAALSLRLA